MFVPHESLLLATEIVSAYRSVAEGHMCSLVAARQDEYSNIVVDTWN